MQSFHRAKLPQQLTNDDAMRLYHPEMIYDLPAGGRRLVQRVDGYDMTLVAGKHQDSLP